MFSQHDAIQALLVRLKTKLLDGSGQSTVEAAFLIPLMLGGILLLIQPGILLYDRMVMNAAASQACRLMVTIPEGDPDAQCQGFVKRRLAAVPQQDCFHVHSSRCTWDVRFEGGEASDTVKVSISTKVQPLPLIGFGANAVGVTDGDGYLTVRVEQSMRTQPDWALSAAGAIGPSEWVGAWLE